LVGHRHTHANINENKIPRPLTTTDANAALGELRINANPPKTTTSATSAHRIVIVGCEFGMAVLCGTSRIEKKQRPIATAPIIPMKILDAMMFNDPRAEPSRAGPTTVG
jgi:hypothetical protein